ncbi:MAG: hypothetical protein HY896_14000 [Deltaproteobacteria bacterium]|nr:hypothetical protein [Deltaproteobacteria bacterium]
MKAVGGESKLSLTICSDMLSTIGGRSLAVTRNRLECSVRRLASGLRINSASDDAAGLALSSSIDAKVKCLYQDVRNANDGISMVQVAESALSTVDGMLGRMRELSVQASNGSLGSRERSSISEEYAHLVEEIDRIAGGTEFNGMKLLDGSAGDVNLKVGTAGYDTLAVSLDAVSTGTLGFYTDTEGPVNTTTNDFQYWPSVTALNGGGYVVAWVSTNQDGSAEGIFGQRYDSSGNKAGSEFQVNGYWSNEQNRPSVIALENGGFIVTWDSLGQDGSGYGVYSRIYDPDGNPAGSEFRVNSTTFADQMAPSAATLDGGGFVIAWMSWPQDGSVNGIFARRYDSSGTALGNDFQVNTYWQNQQMQPDVAALDSGGFVVTWNSVGQDGSGYGVYGQRYDADGNRAGVEFPLHTITAGTQDMPAVAALDGGGFIAAWGSGGDVKAQRFNADGSKSGTEFQVNTTTADPQYYPDITKLDDGGFVVVWEALYQDGSGSGIYGQRFDAGGNMAGGEFRVNDYTDGYQSACSVAGLDGGGFIVAWDSENQDGSATGVYGMRYDSFGNRADFRRIDTREQAMGAIAVVDGAMESVDEMRSGLGAVRNRLESVISVQRTQIDALSSAGSRIKDADFATEAAIMIKHRMIQQAGIAVLSQVRVLPQVALRLLMF